MNLNQVVAGIGAGQVEVVERRKPVEGDRDATFKSALVKSQQDPKGVPFVTKAIDSEEVIDVSRPDACAALIRRAHATSGATWAPFSPDQHVAKAQEIAAGRGRVVKVYREHGEVRFEVVGG